MGSSFVSLHVHVVFATREHRELLDKQWRAQLHRYMAGTLTGLGASAPSVGGTGDHVHLLFGMRASQSLADLVREVKKASTAWIKSSCQIAHFGWQEGYGAFSVGMNSLAVVRQYIEKQELHHERRDFNSEWQEMLTRHALAEQE